MSYFSSLKRQIIAAIEIFWTKMIFFRDYLIFDN